MEKESVESSEDNELWHGQTCHTWDITGVSGESQVWESTFSVEEGRILKSS